jgi:uncharacterized protein YdhG (YjbR/CyaY superfamily)
VKAPGTIDEYLARLSGEKRAALARLRTIIKSAAPRAEECISYHIPTFKQNGMLVGFGASANHCTFFLMSTSIMTTFSKELKRYQTGKGSIRFQPDDPIPATLVKRLVKARIAENRRTRTTNDRRPKTND